MGWHSYADPDTDWNDPDAVLRAAVAVGRQYPSKNPKPLPADHPHGDCWECGRVDTPLWNHGRCANCAAADYGV